MRLSERHRQIIQEMEGDGYVWLSHLPINGQMRFRSKIQCGFKGYVKIEGMVFMTKRVADAIVSGVKTSSSPRLTYKEQVAYLEDQLVQLEAELYRLKGVGSRHEVLKFEAQR